MRCSQLQTSVESVGILVLIPRSKQVYAHKVIHKIWKIVTDRAMFVTKLNFPSLMIAQ